LVIVATSISTYKQGLVIKADISITKMLDKLDIFRKEDANIPTDIIELGTDALGYFVDRINV
jgi:hypothetical protein